MFLHNTVHLIDYLEKEADDYIKYLTILSSNYQLPKYLKPVCSFYSFLLLGVYFIYSGLRGDHTEKLKLDEISFV